MDYARLIKKIRNDLLLTQTEMAEKLGVAFATVNRWENGHNEPSMKIKRKLRDICRRNGIQMEE
ncbi:MAG: helix-turn-helix transcriptional regulator [Bacilli bacterium]|nr:helix-turn-helix transcriptional regulator [Bacilli bacterium]